MEPLVIYIERTPAAPLNQCVRMLWYARASHVPHQRERVLPNGCVQVILNLARDFILDCPENGQVCSLAPSLVVGARAAYEIVDRSDMADLIGVVFAPGGFSPFASDSVDLFSHRSISLEDVWGASARTLRDGLREAPTPQQKLQRLERFLLDKFDEPGPRNKLVNFAIRNLGCAPVAFTVREVAKSVGLSERRFSQIFREEVGLSPKVWRRIQRFQWAVRRLHAGADLRWVDLALDCGYYDQSHFANEFRGFSGIDATSYSARRTRWANHVPVE